MYLGTGLGWQRTVLPNKETLWDLKQTLGVSVTKES